MKINIEEISKKKDVKVLKIKENIDFNIFFSFNDKRKEKLYRELKTLLSASVSLKKAIDIILLQTKYKKEKYIFLEIKDAIIKGSSLSEAMKNTNQFSGYEIYSIQIGEETNNLEHVFAELQLFYYRKIQIKRQVITVLAYPVFVILITIVVLIFMLNNVVPMFAKVFKQFGGELPSLTKKIIFLSNNFNMFFGGFLIILLVFLLIHYFNKRRDSYKNFISLLIFKIPFFGNLINTIYLARFCQSMNLLLSSKTPIIKSLELVKKMINYYPIEKTITPITKQLIKGNSLGNSLSMHSSYDSNLVSMIKVAEEVNEIDEMFNTLAKQYTENVEYKAKTLGVIMEPLIITLIGLIVGVIMIAMYLPMFDLSKILNRN